MSRLITTKEEYGPYDEGKGADKRLLVASFLVPGVLVVVLLFLLISYRGGIEQAVSRLALLLPVGFSFAAGMVASVNPCGVLMLSSYAFYQLRAEGEDASLASRTARAVLVAAVITAGFVLVFAAAGSIIAAGGRWLVTALPLAGLLIGVGMILLGLWLLYTRQTLGLFGGRPLAIDPQRSLSHAFVFGVVYAIGSLSCTLPIFLGVIGTSLVGDLGGMYAFYPFLGYALGMGSVIFVVTVGATLFRRAMARWLRNLMPSIHRLSTFFMIGAGAYLLYYWLTA
jgi:cytochrome c-type biogenesis protein